MTPQRLRSGLLAVCFLTWTGLSLGCDWDHFPDQGLDPASRDAGARHLVEFTPVPDPESCQAACCNDSSCDLAVVGYPADGGPQCLLVRCRIQDRDVCVLRSSSQYAVYRRRVTAASRREAEEGGVRLKIVPLQGAWEPRTSKTNETIWTNETNNIRCRLPMKVGSCRAAFPKFFYDVTNQSCRRFVYGGCESNGNNFDSQDECEAACSGVTGSILPDESTPAPPQLPVKAARMAPAISSKTAAGDFAERCGAEPQVGPCRAMFRRWYFDTQTGRCRTFTFGGCRGNLNNYDSEESCTAACTVSVLPSAKKAAADVSAEFKGRCLVTPDPGPCRAAFPMFYYHPDTATCQPFTYGGCRGNQNRYGSAEECMNRCIGKDGFFEGRGRARNRWTAAIFLFVTLAAVSALLLVTLVVITLRRHRQSHRPSSVSDKEELLPDPDEQSSVESLTVPESPKLDKA